MGNQPSTETLGPPHYFRSLADLFNHNRDRLDDYPWPDKSISGGIVPAAVMFADMSGFSEAVLRRSGKPHGAAFTAHWFVGLLESHCIAGPNTRDAMDRCFIDKIIGDEAMFIVIGEREQAMGDAVNLAGAMHSGTPFSLKFGIHWGEVCVADIGLAMKRNRARALEEVTAMGYAVNVAARLKSVARSGHAAFLQSTDANGVNSTVGVPIPTTSEMPVFDKHDIKGITSDDGEVGVMQIPLPKTLQWEDGFVDDVVDGWLARFDAAGVPPLPTLELPPRDDDE